MKKIMITLCAMALLSYAVGQELAVTLKPANKIVAENAIFSWTETTFDFGKVKVGIPVSHEFSFTNTGNVPLVITSVKASCGCTVTSYTKEPIGTGSQGFVKATYNAAKAGQFSKTVTINANTQDGIVQLTVKGEVVQK